MPHFGERNTTKQLRNVGNVEEEMVSCKTNNSTIDTLTNSGFIFEVHDEGKFFTEPYTPKESFTLRIRYCLLLFLVENRY